MHIRIALAGNPNSGKTTIFNKLTGSNQYVGNWPGVTVEKKEGKMKGHKDVVIQDLPGIYSLSPYSPEEIITRTYLINDRPDAIINIIDGTNIERNLYLTTQLLDLGIPVVIAINMMDAVEKRGDKVDFEKLERRLGCRVVCLSALKGSGAKEAAKAAIESARAFSYPQKRDIFESDVELALGEISDIISSEIHMENLRWYSVKLMEGDIEAEKELSLSETDRGRIDAIKNRIEKKYDDTGESIVINQRYNYLTDIVKACVVRSNARTVSDRIDTILTGRITALPIFAIIMFLVYFISVTTIGAALTNWTNDVLFGQYITPNVISWLAGINVAPWLSGLIVDGIIGGVGGVLGFVPQMTVLFLILSFLEDCGYMSRIAFIMDRLFRKLGLSGKSFIPLLVGTGCSVPGIMASRTIEVEKDRRMTIITTSFIPCGAKLPLIALIAGALFGGAWWVAPTAYFAGIGAVIVSGIILKKTKLFSGDTAPFVMELPPYRLPRAKNIFSTTMDRSMSFIKRAGTVILLSSIVLWFLQSYGFTSGVFSMVEDNSQSILSYIGRIIAPIFEPLGFGIWQASVGTVTGLMAKENIVSTLGILYGFAGTGGAGMDFGKVLAADFTQLSAISFMIFNLLCAPCFAAMSAIRKEMNSPKWTVFAIGYMCLFAYATSLVIYQMGMLITTGTFTVLTAVAFAVLAAGIYLLFRKNPNDKKENVL